MKLILAFLLNCKHSQCCVQKKKKGKHKSMQNSSPAKSDKRKQT